MRRWKRDPLLSSVLSMEGFEEERMSDLKELSEKFGLEISKFGRIAKDAVRLDPGDVIAFNLIKESDQGHPLFMVRFILSGGQRHLDVPIPPWESEQEGIELVNGLEELLDEASAFREAMLDQMELRARSLVKVPLEVPPPREDLRS